MMNENKILKTNAIDKTNSTNKPEKTSQIYATNTKNSQIVKNCYKQIGKPQKLIKVPSTD